MNPPKGKGKATQSKEARKAGMSQQKYESTKLNEAYFKSLKEKQQQSQPQSKPKPQTQPKAKTESQPTSGKSTGSNANTNRKPFVKKLTPKQESAKKQREFYSPSNKAQRIR
jgi:hypothetical protein